ncbi:glycosyltransferase family 9 protein [Bradyrhizobium niftali]|uniref:glycosyltransferase family 9 protein n=1 Tax=Bradyrhizobium niftali TaxID=2560055 RepID=UPI00384C3109
MNDSYFRLDGQEIPPAADNSYSKVRLGGCGRTVLVHVASGIGNIVLATPLLLTLYANDYIVDLLVDGDYPETAELFDGWNILRAVYSGRTRQHTTGNYDIIIAAIPPFYWRGYASRYDRVTNCIQRPPDALFYRNEQAYYLEFARALGICMETAPPCYRLPAERFFCADPDTRTVVLAPGCKTGEMSAKRWPHFVELANRFEHVAVVGTPDDLRFWGGSSMSFSGHCRMLAGQLTLRETAAVLAGASVVVANDSGLGHLAAALGAATIMLFGPTPDETLGPFPPNVTVLRSGFSCEPCWFTPRRFGACRRTVECLTALTVDSVVAAIIVQLKREQASAKANAFATKEREKLGRAG